MRFLCVLVGALCTYSACAEVVELTVENFEHLTQASTGATTGDWFVGKDTHLYALTDPLMQ
jgi:hypothetical protein